ncbi:MAG: NAD(P)-dependent oxidoreductase [Candidatus Eremiobacteraeota bacterium]|nr:NAD(P)-dependent oxidoreductase [Candidatus Eremiobacteraeota bacterium]
MRILVTGNQGYVGTVLTRVLREAGHHVRGYDAGFFAANEIEPAPAPHEQIQADIRDCTAADLAEVDAVAHLAALSNDPLGALDASLTHDINVNGTEVLLNAAEAAGVRRIVFASSCSLYGKSDAAALDETCELQPLTAYARSKVDCEALLSERSNRVSATVLRFATAFGYSERPRLDLVVNNLVASALTNGVIALESDGTPWRPLVHVEDMCQAILLALEGKGDAEAGPFNVGSEGENYQIRDIARVVSDAMDGLPVTMKSAAESGDQRSYNVSFARFARAFPQFTARWTLRRGVEDLVARFRASFDIKDFASERYFRLRRIKSLLAQGQIDDVLRRREDVAHAP